MFTYVIGGAIVTCLLLLAANYRRDAKGKSRPAQISVDTDEFEATVGDAAPSAVDADAPATTVVQLDDDNWEDLLLKTKSNLPMIIEFYTKKCPGCITQAPIYARASVKYASRARFFSVDCDEFDHLARVGDVKRIPTIFFIEPNSKAQIVNVGRVELDEFATFLQQLAAQAASGAPVLDPKHPYLFD